MDALTDDATGRYLVTTESGSHYTLDFNRRVFRRTTDPTLVARHGLRGDGEDIDLVEVMQCRLGRPMILLINLWVPDVWFTTRESSPVVRIEPMPEQPGRL
ncbi:MULTISPECIES: hypothetical protein [unclassified Cryobacterium]|uniref:hypothetical protein n=1 Tax=unclassified Cryobacterium TaxID=2649013 RepID=UPI00106CE12B|nr:MULTISPECIES: hypothetical protein [unclassified Cryobacterium]TFB97662.1 hypothetical protein E3O39_07570 [Cryobacterium sp. MDB2-A-1]TFC03695.1 hypothetical protein E3O59_15455 [Cryobacterium sp. MDB2-33-2]TFC07782.1 hypothetical protein E3O35_18200 [Cryobacterium sp. MDB2-A-2]